MVAKSIFANHKCIEEWLEESSRTIKKDPRNKAVLDVHVALDEAYDLYFPTVEAKDSNILPTVKRLEIFSRFERSARTGCPNAMFFEGLARREGFGCKKDLTTGNALIQVAAIARNCNLALNYLGVSYFSQAPEMALKFFQQAALNGYDRAYKNLGIASLYGRGIGQSYAEAIRCFKTAGAVARNELAQVAQHLKYLQARAQLTAAKPQEAKVVILDQAARTTRPQMVM